LLGICTPGIRISRTSAGYQRYNKRISREYLPNYNKISAILQQNVNKYLLDIPSQISVDSGQRVKKPEKSLKTAMLRLNPIAG